MSDPLSIAGAPVSGADLTYSWGLAPASGTIHLPGAVTISPGQDVVMTLGARVFYGVLNSNPQQTKGDEGVYTTLTIVDNRVKLMWDEVYGTFNNADIREADAGSGIVPGVGRQKRFWHILPADWANQKRTWTDAPKSAAEVIGLLLQAPTLRYAWVTELHDAQQKPVYDIDCNNGAKLGNVLQEISEQQGLVFTLDGFNTLIWTRKGDGELPEVPIDCASDFELGEALSPNATSVRLVGDRSRYQDMPVTLESDWVTAYEAFWIEPLWLAEVESTFGPFDPDVSGRATLAAKARTVTVRDYVAKKGSDFADYGRWGETGRMEIPVWIYLQDIVFKAYRVPADYAVNGIPLESLQMVEGLLAAVDYDIDAGTLSLKDPREYYPEAKAFVLVQGQPIDLLDPHTQNFSRDQLEAGAQKWTPSNKFNLDVKNNAVIFEHAVFVPGTGEQALFVFPNQAAAGIDDTHPLYQICAPNSAVTVSHATVKAAFTWEAEKYCKLYGSGTRRSPQYVRSLGYHALLNAGAFVEEVKYADGEGADDKADEFAGVLTAQNATYASGGYKRVGSSGTALSGTVDRVTVSLSEGAGLVESVELTKERAAARFEPERELERRSRSKDLFPGQKNLNSAAEQLMRIAKISKEIKRNAAAGYANVAQTQQTPVGGVDCAMSTFDTTDTWKAGQPVYLDATTMQPAPDGKVFAGINVAHLATGKGVAVAKQGTVAVLVQGPFNTGDAIGIDDGTDQSAKVGGGKPLGIANATYTGSDKVLAPVRLGAGDGGSTVGGAFDVAISPDTPGSADGATATFSGGSAGGRVPENVLEDLAVPTGDLSYCYVEITTDGKTPQSCVLKISTEEPDPVQPTMNSLPLTVPVIIHLIDYTAPTGSATVGTYESYRVFWPPDDIVLKAVEAYRSSVDNPEPGALPYDIWYNWEVVSGGADQT